MTENQSIRFACSRCGKRLKADQRHAGRAVNCPKCGTTVHVPPPAPQPGPTREMSTIREAEPAEPRVVFSKPRGDDEGMDLTPMVDVTFLLVIFFMVTAAFQLQKSLEVPAPDQSENAAQSRTIEELEEDDDFIIVRIEGDNTVWVDESIAHSQQEILTKLREARNDASARGPNSLLVVASGDAHHESVVTALDAGNAVGMENIRLATLGEDEL